MAEPASPEMLAEVDGKMADVYEAVITTGFDQDMDQEERRDLYMLLRFAFSHGRSSAFQEIIHKYTPETYS